MGWHGALLEIGILAAYGFLGALMRAAGRAERAWERVGR